MGRKTGLLFSIEFHTNTGKCQKFEINNGTNIWVILSRIECEDLHAYIEKNCKNNPKLRELEIEFSFSPSEIDTKCRMYVYLDGTIAYMSEATEARPYHACYRLLRDFFRKAPKILLMMEISEYDRTTQRSRKKNIYQEHENGHLLGLA